MEQLLYCPDCNKSFSIIYRFGESKIIRCGCHSYPVINEIYYIKKNYKANQAIKWIFKKNIRRAVLVLIAQRKVVKAPLYFFLEGSKIDYLSKLFFHKSFIKLMGPKRLFTLLGFILKKDRLWYRYLLNRTKYPTYFFTLFTTALIRKGNKVIDLGCGVGQYFQGYYKRIKPSQLIGVDINFFSLYISRIFYANDKTLLICSDLEKKISIRNSSVDLAFSNDSFFNIVNKPGLIQEIYRILKQKGIFSVVHMINSEKKLFEFCHGMLYENFKILLYSSGFKIVRGYSETTLWKHINAGSSLSLNRSDRNNVLRRSLSYTIFSGKRNLPVYLQLSQKYYRLIKKTKIDCRLDSELRSINVII
jgi:ubiquinone/menaquinone biosynthesis C-methylase UbiE